MKSCIWDYKNLGVVNPIWLNKLRTPTSKSFCSNLRLSGKPAKIQLILKRKESTVDKNFLSSY